LARIAKIGWGAGGRVTPKAPNPPKTAPKPPPKPPKSVILLKIMIQIFNYKTLYSTKSKFEIQKCEKQT